jgi:hypothetical protein
MNQNPITDAGVGQAVGLVQQAADGAGIPINLSGE